MVTISTANLFRTPPLMAQIKVSQFFEFIAFWATSRAERKEQRCRISALPYSHLDGAQVALQRCLILRPSFIIVTVLVLSLFKKRTSLLCIDRFTSQTGESTFNWGTRIQHSIGLNNPHLGILVSEHSVHTSLR